jgi:hypothetical protein
VAETNLVAIATLEKACFLRNVGDRGPKIVPAKRERGSPAVGRFFCHF